MQSIQKPLHDEIGQQGRSSHGGEKPWFQGKGGRHGNVETRGPTSGLTLGGHVADQAVDQLRHLHLLGACVEVAEHAVPEDLAGRRTARLRSPHTAFP